MLSGLFVTNINLPDTIYNGKVTVTTAGARVQLTTDITRITSGILIKALSTNTGLIYIGDVSVSAANGFQLAASDTAFIEIVDRSPLYIDSAENGDGITYIATGVYSIVPSIVSVAPVGGLPADDTKAITVTGGNFIGVDSATGVTIDGNPCTSVTVTAATTLTAVVPVGTVGAKTVAVIGVGGTGTLASGYTYADAPTASGISPASGTEDGGTTVTITGTNFVNTPFVIGVTIGGAACTGVVTASDTSIIAVTPAGTLGAQDVVVTTESGSGTLAGGFTYISSWSNTKSALFDGTDDYYQGDAIISSTSGQAFTFSFWAKDPSLDDYKVPLCLNVGGVDDSVILFYFWSTNKFYFRAGTGEVGGSRALSIDTWYHFVGTYDSAGTKKRVLYIDGVEDGSSTAAASTMELDRKLRLAIIQSGPADYYNLNVDEVSVWIGVALTPAEVVEVYNLGGTATPGDLVNDGPQVGSLQHWYRMGDDASDSPTVGVDQMGNINLTGYGGVTIESDVP